MPALVHDQPAEAWLDQSADDFAAARYLLDGGYARAARCFAHLAVEKALKGRFRRRTGALPPVTHRIADLAQRSHLVLPDALHATVEALDATTVRTLYAPADPTAADASAPVATTQLLDRTAELLDWIAAQS